MSVTVTQLQKKRLSPEEEAQQLAEFAPKMKEMLVHLLIGCSVQPALDILTQSIVGSSALLAKVCPILPSIESNERYSKYHFPALDLRRPVKVNVTINWRPSVLPIIIIRDGE